MYISMAVTKIRQAHVSNRHLVGNKVLWVVILLHTYLQLTSVINLRNVYLNTITSIDTFPKPNLFCFCFLLNSETVSQLIFCNPNSMAVGPNFILQLTFSLLMGKMYLEWNGVFEIYMIHLF